MKKPFEVNMRRGEIIGGIIWFLVYLLGMDFILEPVLALMGIENTLSNLNAAYYFSSFLITAFVFRRFLADSLPTGAGALARCLKALVLGYVVYELLQVATVLVGSFLVTDMQTPNDEIIMEIAGENYWIMWVGAVLLGPLTEETLIRGLVFGNLRRINRLLAYVVTALLFAVLHMAAFLGEMDLETMLFNGMVYGLPSVALCVAYEYSGTIWTAVVLHMLLNAITMTLGF